MATDPSPLKSAIEEAAAAPESVAADGVVVRGRSIDDLIKADKYLAEQAAAAKPHRGLRFSRVIPPGARGE